MGLYNLTAQIDWHGTVQGSVSVRFVRFDGDRHEFHYVVRNHLGDVLAEGEDLRSGSTRSMPNAVDMLATLLDFLSACGESFPEGDNADMFPPACAMWADSLQDELSMAREELRSELTPF